MADEMLTMVVWNPTMKQLTLFHEGQEKVYDGALKVYQVAQDLSDIVFRDQQEVKKK